MQRLQLLLLEGNSRGQGSHMPVNMTVSLLATQRQQIHPLCRHNLPDCFGDTINQGLQSKILFEAKVGCHLLAMLLGADQSIAVQQRIFVEKHDGLLILINHVVGILRIAGDDLTDKTGAGLYLMRICLNIDGKALGHCVLRIAHVECYFLVSAAWNWRYSCSNMLIRTSLCHSPPINTPSRSMPS